MESKKSIFYSYHSVLSISALLVIFIISMFFAGDVGTSMAAPVFGPQFEISTGCGANKAQVMELIGGDHPQTAAWQDSQWKYWKTQYPGLVDSDRLGNATYAYNCHSYIFNGSQYWINDPSPYKGTSAGCYSEDPNGTIRSEGTRHSCTVDYVGKCGDGFFMKRNELVYGSVNPIYKKKSVASIPTLSQWKKIFLTLLMLSLLMGFIPARSSRYNLNGEMMSGIAEVNMIVFNKQLFWTVMKWVCFAAIWGLINIKILWCNVSTLDITGTVFCSPLVAYILHLIILYKCNIDETRL